jgi:Protein of unknown function (DUF3592)
MDVIHRIVALLGCLVRAALFGGIGAAACWVLATSVRDAQDARDWVKVRADVVSTNIALADVRPSLPGKAAGIYRYKVGEQEYTGSRLSSMTVAGEDPFSDWQDAMQGFLQSASDEKRNITVNVNPDNPAIAVIDRDLRWGMLSFLVPFALVFTLIGLGSAYGFVCVLLAPTDAITGKTSAVHPASLWIFAFIWNVISFPVAGATIPDLVNDGDWEGWFILFFPLIGILLAYAGIKRAIKYHRARWGREE